MIINLKIEDALYDRYLTNFGAPKHYAQMKRAIEEFSGIKFADRALILHGEGRKAVEAEFQTTLDSAEKLLSLVKSLKMVKIHGVEINFTPDELARLEMQAKFHGRTTDGFIREIITEIKDRMLEKV